MLFTINNLKETTFSKSSSAQAVTEYSREPHKVRAALQVLSKKLEESKTLTLAS